MSYKQFAVKVESPLYLLSWMSASLCGPPIHNWQPVKSQASAALL